jgi:hypothetical protein
MRTEPPIRGTNGEVGSHRDTVLWSKQSSRATVATEEGPGSVLGWNEAATSYLFVHPRRQGLALHHGTFLSARLAACNSEITTCHQ